MSSTAFKVIGPCTIKWNSKLLGVTKTGVIIRPRMAWAPVTDDAHGSEPSDYIHTGRSCQVECIGLEVSQLKDADVFAELGGFLKTDSGVGEVGKLASAVGKELEIIERDGTTDWKAYKSVPIDPETLLFVSTTELQIPLTFLIVPDDNDKLFYDVPTYIQ